MQSGYLLSGALCLLAAGDSPKTPDKGLQALEGKWDLSLAINTHHVLNQYNVPFTIAGGKISWTRLPFVNDDPGKGMLVLDATKSPHTIDLKTGGQIYPGIYRFRTSRDGRTEHLDLLFAKPGGERPKAFAPSELQTPKDFAGFLLTADRPQAEAPDAAKKELAGLQGAWQCRGSESGGKDAGPEEAKAWVLVFDQGKMIYQRNGAVVGEGDLQIDPTKSPKQLTARFPTLNQTDVMIFLRVGDVLILCGNRDGKTRPTQFVTGTTGGGAFLTAWERVK